MLNYSNHCILNLTVGSADEVAVVKQGLPQRLMESIRTLKLSNQFDIRTDKPAGGRSLQRYLLHALWDSGSGSGRPSDPQLRQAQAEKALRVICTIYTTDSWVGGSMDDDSENNPWRKYPVWAACPCYSAYPT